MAAGERPARIAFFDAYAHDAGAGLALRDIVARIDRERFEPIALLARHGPLAALLAEVGCPVEVLEPPPPLGVIGGGLATAGAWRKLRLGLALVRYSSTVARWLRAREIDAEVVLKATKVDGVYARDPVEAPDAERYETLSYSEAIERRLQFMDAAALSLCRENGIPIVVFDFFREGNIERALKGEPVGTRIAE